MAELKIEDALEKAKDVLLRAGITARDVEIRYFQKVDDTWRVNISYTKSVGDILTTTSALLSIDAVTGQVIEFREGWAWK